MSMSKDYRVDIDYLLQRDLITGLIPRVGKDVWQVVYAIDDKSPDRFAIFSALLEPHVVQDALNEDSWDLHIGDGLPGFSQTWQSGKETTIYHRFGTEGIRPLVICRDFHDVWPSYIELCEEFRHFHNLAEDRKNQRFLDFDESGYEIEVAKIFERRVEINWRYLRRFLAATQLYLAVYFDSVRYSRMNLEDVPKKQRLLKHRDATSHYSLHVRTCDFHEEFRTFSRLLGKVIIAPPPIEACDEWPFYEKCMEPEVSFVIGANPDGTLIEHTSSPDKLANYFGANPGAPNYLTPVYFRREVLQKYFAEPERYSVEDGYLRCLGLWGMQIDNNHPTHVVAFLGDLGRDLPYAERLHWRQYNVPPPRDARMSETCSQRSFLAQFSDPSSVDLIFRNEYQELNHAWRERLGWPLFLAPDPGDEHIFKAIHVPVSQSQRELDEQILWLAKLLVDSLNEAELAKGFPENDGRRGIDKFESFLKSKRCDNVEEMVQFLRDLQKLRSTGTAHRKGQNYQKAINRLDLAGKSAPDVMRIVLERAVDMIRTLRRFLDEIEM
ncbi:MAG: hypothetical protein KatS3mg055_1681 [Chloroflexus sp.]|uniref:hypothetical protein n=1 Tax=Chloroflexus sp. TaxID=1904827 RepID=UPI0021DDD873|nr:hypothetical protein [Chloroflexus sp.]GIV89163.1 MAG: hypothetical protein KatS3mg055_1681 [Chloroflexus sp.]